MSSTYVADTSDDHKADNTLIIIVNNDGTVSVDQETLQNLLANQHNTPVSLVRLSGHSHGDDSSQDSNGTCDSQNDGNPHVNLTVEGFYPPAAVQPTPEVVVPADPEPLEPEPDPFLEIDSEQLKRLETALQSEQAKQILGENVTAMLDMLSVDEQASHLKDTIRMDHCYTSLTPASAPPTPTPQVSNNQYGASGTAGADGNYERDETKQQTTGMGMPVQPQQTLRGRGRGRGPGRPRKDTNVSRGATTAYRGGVIAGRGGAIRVQRGANSGSVVMMQQIKSITPLAPPPNSPSSASLVPLIRPLVLPAQTTTVQGIRSTIQTISKNKVMTVPVSSGNTRFVTVAGKPVQVVDSNGQQRVFVATSQSTVQLQQVPNHTSQVQIASSTVKQEVSSSDQKKQIQDLGSSSVISGMHNLAQAKVVVAKMPEISSQLMSAQAASVAHGQTETKEAEADFTDFQQEETDDESEEISEEDADTDEDYKDSSSRRRPSRGGAKSRGGRFHRGGRAKGRGRSWDSSRVVGRGGRQRGGRGRILVRPEDADRAKKLELEMAAALAAMEKSPDREALAKQVNSEATAPEEAEGKSLITQEEPLCSPLVDSSTFSPAKKKAVKVYGRSVGKKNVVLANEEVHVQVGGDVPVHGEEKERTPTSTSSITEKKSPTTKSPVRKLSTEISHTSPPNHALTPTPTPPPTTPTPTTPAPTPSVAPAPTSTTSTSSSAPHVTPVVEVRKNYPKRENRKPPAHLADAFGPALFSTPDIIRRVSTGGESKIPSSTETSPQETKKEVMKSSPEAKSPVVITPTKLTEFNTPTTSSEKATGEVAPVSTVAEPVPAAEEEQVKADSIPVSSLAPPASSELKIEEEVVTAETVENENVVADTAITSDSEKFMEIVDNKSVGTEAVTSSLQALSPQKAPTDSGSQKSSQEMSQISPSSSQMEPVAAVPKLPPATVAVTRSARRRSSTHQSPEPAARRKHVPAGQSKDKRKQDDVRSKTRRRPSEVEAEDEESSGDESWNSEDDPDRLWCICKKPHNNRFMICCDVCEDWFHGKCVGVTKAMGQQMENKGLEWSCPNCSKKKEVEEKPKEEKKPIKIAKDKEVKKISKDVKRESVTEADSAVVNHQIASQEKVAEVSSITEGDPQQARFCGFFPFPHIIITV